MLIAALQAVAGLVMLVFAGDFLVRGSVSTAERLGVPALLIGLTIVAFGTSAPELFVGVSAVLEQAPTLALGNVVGSNIANILLVLGVPAILAPMTCHAPRLNRNVAIMLGATALFIGLAFTGGFAAWQAGLLLATLAAFLLYSGMRAKSDPEAAQEILDFEEEIGEVHDRPLAAAAFILGGLVGLVLGAHMLVDGSVVVARSLGVSEAVIGLTLVAIGTSLPELATSVAAALRCHCDVAVGNVVGSNIFNLLAITGVASLFGTIPVPDSFLRVDLWVMMAASLALLPFTLTRGTITRFSGALLLLAYGGYMSWLIYDGAAMEHMAALAGAR